MKRGFTLAEVLITLAVIGVVAAIVLPSVIQNIQDAEYRTAWKKGYAELTIATKQILADNGGTLKPYINVTQAICPLYAPYLNIVKKNYMWDPPSGYCMPAWGCHIKKLSNIEESSGPAYAYFDDCVIGGTPYQLVLSNGMSLAAENYSGDSNPDILWLDVNGFGKSPNVIGRDIFGVAVNENGIKPLGSTGDGFENTCTTDNVNYAGWGCAAKVIRGENY